MCQANFTFCAFCELSFGNTEKALEHIKAEHTTEFRNTRNSESEKFFRHLNNGEVRLEKVWVEKPADNFNGGTELIETTDYRITITEKGLTQ